MADSEFQRVQLPNGFGGKHISDGRCLDCNVFASTFHVDGVMTVVHEGNACAKFKRRFGKEGATAALDQSGSFRNFTKTPAKVDAFVLPESTEESPKEVVAAELIDEDEVPDDVKRGD